MERTKKFVEFTISGNELMIEGFMQDMEQVTDDIDFKRMEDVDPSMIAAGLSHLIDVNGDLDKVDMDDLERNFGKMVENKEEIVNDVVVEERLFKAIVSNDSIMKYISEILLDKMGKKIDLTQMKESMAKIFHLLKSSAYYSKKVVQKFFDWISAVLKIEEYPNTLLRTICLEVAVVALMGVSAALFPEAIQVVKISGALTILVSMTSILGSGKEAQEMTDHIMTVVSSKIGEVEDDKKALTSIEKLTL